MKIWVLTIWSILDSSESGGYNKYFKTKEAAEQEKLEIYRSQENKEYNYKYYQFSIKQEKVR